ncbi:MAG: diguanylate cyclase [Gaiellaceae bacterium]
MEEPARSDLDLAGKLIRLVTPEPMLTPVDDGLVDSYRRLSDVYHELLSEQSLDALLDRIADALAELVPYEALHIYEADEARRELVPRLVRSEWASEILNERFPYGEGITGWAVEKREPVLANQAHLHPLVRFVPGTPVEPESLIVIPMIARGLLKGTFNIYRIGEEASFGEQEFELAKRFGDAAALALDNAHIRARLEHQAQTDSLTGLFNHRYFHERLRRELTLASGAHESVAVVMIDIDDFKKVNDVYGHGLGDQVLAELANHLRATVRTSDVVCRIGGEEFAVILPASEKAHALALVERLSARLDGVELELAGKISVSTGIAYGPEHAANPRELVACAEAAMMTAKARGKRQVVLFGEHASERPGEPELRREDVRSIAHLKLLQSLAGKLNRLNDVREIGMAIANELRLLIDYHNCRIFLREGENLLPIAFQGDLAGSDGAAFDVLATKVGDGFTGWVAEHGESLLLPDAARCEFAVEIEGTDAIEESVIAVPLNLGSRVLGVIVVSKLGIGQLDDDDMRLLEVLAGHAAVALENARLYEAQTREAQSAHALLDFSRELATAEELESVHARVVEGSARMLGAPHASLWLQEEGAGDLICCAATGYGDHNSLEERRFPAASLAPFAARAEPYLLSPAEYSAFSVPPAGGSGMFAIAPFSFDGRWGAIAVGSAEDTVYGQRELELLGGLAHQTKLAIANATSFKSLERTFLSTIEALANALEARDQYTSSHARWITDMALKVGEELELDADTLKRLELGALFHDIGKIGIPNSVLLKPGRLTDEERALIETHPEVGARILAPIDQLEDVCSIVRACHERWDGLGYPDRKAGEEIPLEARIIFACDAFHAMTTDRPYRSKLAVEEALRRLREAAGAQFDPRVVEICVRLLEAPPAT